MTLAQFIAALTLGVSLLGGIAAVGCAAVMGRKGSSEHTDRKTGRKR